MRLAGGQESPARDPDDVEMIRELEGELIVYRAVDKAGQTIDLLLTTHRHESAAKRVLTRAIRRHGVPETITIDGSEANVP